MTHRCLIFVTALAASCSPSGEGNASATGASGPEPTAVVTAASRGAGDCSYLWNGEPATEQKILDKSVVAIFHAIEDVGGIEKLTEEAMPLLRLKAAPDVPYSCTGPALRQFERAGLLTVLLKPAGAPDQRANFFMDPPPEGPFAIVRLGKQGMSWDGRPIDRAGLLERVRAEGMNRPPVELVVAPAEDSSYLALHDALATMKQGGMEATVSGCAGTSGPVRTDNPVC